MPFPKRVLIESPFRGENWAETKRNIYYAKLCMRDSILRGEAPIASHLIYTQTGILNDKVPEERLRGIHAGQAWGLCAELSAFYIDFDFSEGMEYGYEFAQKHKIKIVHRSLGSSRKIEKL
jgi:hypothetical protein